MNKSKHYFYDLLEASPVPNIFARNVRLGIMLLIVLNITAVILETVSAVEMRYGHLLRVFEILSVAVFTLEYALRLYSCSRDSHYRGLSGHLRFMFTPFALIDLIAILPFYLPIFFAFDLRVLRALRLIRIFRILKLGRYSESVVTIVRVFKKKQGELLVTLFSLTIMLAIASSVMYYFEHEAQPDKFSSIPAAMWWGLITLTTVGYGDMTPVTAMGKLFGCLIAVLGVGIFAMPAAILASAFSEEIRIKREKEEAQYCPHCGKEI